MTMALLYLLLDVVVYEIFEAMVLVVHAEVVVTTMVDVDHRIV